MGSLWRAYRTTVFQLLVAQLHIQKEQTDNSNREIDDNTTVDRDTTTTTDSSGTDKTDPDDTVTDNTGFDLSIFQKIPRSKAKILVWSDQFQNIGESNYRFVAENFVGTQKITPNHIRGLRAINPQFLVLQYHKAYGSDEQSNILSSGEWGRDVAAMEQFARDNPRYGSFESYFMHHGTGAEGVASRVQHEWDGNMEYYLANVESKGFKQYVSAETIKRCKMSVLTAPFSMQPISPATVTAPTTGLPVHPKAGQQQEASKQAPTGTTSRAPTGNSSKTPIKQGATPTSPSSTATG